MDNGCDIFIPDITNIKGWEVVCYRQPNIGEYYEYNGTINRCAITMCYHAWVMRPVKTKRLVVKLTECDNPTPYTTKDGRTAYPYQTIYGFNFVSYEKSSKDLHDFQCWLRREDSYIEECWFERENNYIKE
jgi:hypothetical protein